MKKFRTYYFAWLLIWFNSDLGGLLISNSRYGLIYGLIKHFSITITISMSVQWVYPCQVINLKFSFQGREIYQAKIYKVKNRGKLEFTCSTYGLKGTFKKNSKLYIYLCRNGTGIEMRSSYQDATFFIDDTRMDNTGNYSCVFSVDEHKLEAVRGNGINSIFISVNGKIFLIVLFTVFCYV